MLLDGWLDHKRQRRIKAAELAYVFRIPGRGDRDVQSGGQFIGLAFVPGPPDRLPGWGGNTKSGSKLVAMQGQGRHRLFASRKYDPSVELQALADLEQCPHRGPFVPQASHGHRVRGVAGIACDRLLVVDDAHGDAAPAKAAGDAKALVITTDNDGANPLAHVRSTRAANAVIRRAATSAPETNRQIGP